MRVFKLFSVAFFIGCVLSIAACAKKSSQTERHSAMNIAPGAPGKASTWAFSGKQGIGTSYEAYLDGVHSESASTGEVSKVWFSLAKGVLTETMYGMIHEAQLKDLQLVVVGQDFADIESEATDTKVEYLYTDEVGRPLSLAYKITNTDKNKLYIIEKFVFTHPDTQALFHRVVFKPFADNLKLFLAVNPHVANTGEGDSAWVDHGLHASDGDTVITVLADKLEHPSVGFVGRSDLITDLQMDGEQHWQYLTTGEVSGNVVLGAQLPIAKAESTTIDIVLGFGATVEQSNVAASTALIDGFDTVLAKYNGEGKYLGWEDYLASLDGLYDIRDTARDGGKLLHASALVLKAQEDKTYSGALIASLSNPWGDTVSAAKSATGYKAVWPRDFYQCAMAFLALGDLETPLVAFEYLKKVQVTESTPGNSGATGWFLQKTHVNGELEWVSVQLDQTAMPIMLGWKLWQQGVLDARAMQHWYKKMLQPAAEFLVDGGQLDLLWNKALIVPPYTQQERWEEQEGYSPSTMAAVVAGLVTAADMARALGDSENAQKYLAAADKYESMIDPYTYTTSGVFTGDQGNGKYYLRATQNTDPNDNGRLHDRNGRGVLQEKQILDGGFLELVRYGVRAADDPRIVDTLEELDSQNIDHEFRVKYLFGDGKKSYPGWRRYGDDGYGEDAQTGAGYAEWGKNTPGQRGRVWPFFTGERGHYELAALANAQAIDGLLSTYVEGVEYFANEGLMLPEQVWDGVGVATKHLFELGEGTNSATPLAWTHAEYIKLVRSIHDRQVWDFYPIVRERYTKP